MIKVLNTSAAILLMLAVNLFGQQVDGTERIQRALAGLKWTGGSVVLGNGIANLTLTPDFRYLTPDDAEKALVDIWGNPPAQPKTLGMIFPANMSPVAQGNRGVVITYREDGYVEDDDAEKNQL